jgi:hypothetical protein
MINKRNITLQFRSPRRTLRSEVSQNLAQLQKPKEGPRTTASAHQRWNNAVGALIAGAEAARLEKFCHGCLPPVVGLLWSIRYRFARWQCPDRRAADMLRIMKLT